MRTKPLRLVQLLLPGLCLSLVGTFAAGVMQLNAGLERLEVTTSLITQPRSVELEQALVQLGEQPEALDGWSEAPTSVKLTALLTLAEKESEGGANALLAKLVKQADIEARRTGRKTSFTDETNVSKYLHGSIPPTKHRSPDVDAPDFELNPEQLAVIALLTEELDRDVHGTPEKLLAKGFNLGPVEAARALLEAGSATAALHRACILQGAGGCQEEMSVVFGLIHEANPNVIRASAEATELLEESFPEAGLRTASTIFAQGPLKLLADADLGEAVRKIPGLGDLPVETTLPYHKAIKDLVATTGSSAPRPRPGPAPSPESPEPTTPSIPMPPNEDAVVDAPSAPETADTGDDDRTNPKTPSTITDNDSTCSKFKQAVRSQRCPPPGPGPGPIGPPVVKWGDGKLRQAIVRVGEGIRTVVAKVGVAKVGVAKVGVAKVGVAKAGVAKPSGLHARARARAPLRWNEKRRAR